MKRSKATVAAILLLSVALAFPVILSAAMPGHTRANVSKYKKTTFYRPEESSGSIFLNTLMYKELLAMKYISDCLGMQENGRKTVEEF